MKKKIITIMILLLVVQALSPIIATAEKNATRSFPTQIEVVRYVYTSTNYGDAPNTIFTQEWRNNVFYSGYIPKVSWVYLGPGEIRITYRGFIQFDPSISPDDNLNLVER